MKLKIKEKLVFSKLFPSSLAHSIGDQRNTSVGDVGRLGAGGGGSGVVHPVVAWAAVSIASENKGGGVWEHDYQWGCYYLPCYYLFLRRHFIDSCHWYPHTRWLALTFKIRTGLKLQ